MARQITIEEVKKHRRKNSVWMIIHNDVYDVTSFLNEHPGGEDSLLEFAGKDGTQAFEDIGHSDDAREMMKKYKIGSLPPDQRNKNIIDCQSQPIKSDYRRTYDQIRQDRAARRVSAINVPRDSTCSPSYYKWALLALTGALVLGIVWKKYLAK